MEYLEVKIYTTTKGIDPVSGIFLAAGVDGFVVEDPGDFYELMEKIFSMPQVGTLVQNEIRLHGEREENENG